MTKEDLEYIQCQFEHLKKAEQIKNVFKEYYNKIKDSNDEDFKEIITIAYDFAENHRIDKQTVVDNISVDY